jgi:uncharacterized protein YaiL (DUF2058 family)
MSKSLQDQLLNAGLIDKKKAKAAQKEKRKQAKQQPKGHEKLDETKLRAQQALQEKAERSKELSRLQQQEADKKAILAQIKQLITTNRIDREGGEVAHQFVDNKKIKKLYVTERLQNQLTKGLIAVVKLGEQYELVPQVVAEKIAQRDDSFVILLNTKSTDVVDEDDPYADYQIPDDLMW